MVKETIHPKAHGSEMLRQCYYSDSKQNRSTHRCSDPFPAEGLASRHPQAESSQHHGDAFVHSRRWQLGVNVPQKFDVEDPTEGGENSDDNGAHSNAPANGFQSRFARFGL